MRRLARYRITYRFTITQIYVQKHHKLEHNEADSKTYNITKLIKITSKKKYDLSVTSSFTAPQNLR